MISIRAGEKRDIGLDASGRLALAEGLSAITQNCVTALSAQLGEMIHAADQGVPTMAAVWEKYNPAVFEAMARKTLANVAGVLEVRIFEQRREGDALVYTAEIMTETGIARIEV